LNGGRFLNKKKLYNVSVIGATVCFFSKEKRIAFLDERSVMYWIDLEADRTFSKMNFVEGQLVWLYLLKDISRVISVVYNNSEKVEELPQMEPVAL